MKYLNQMAPILLMLYKALDNNMGLILNTTIVIVIRIIIIIIVSCNQSNIGYDNYIFGYKPQHGVSVKLC